MAVVKHARVERTDSVGPDTRLLELQLDEPLGFTGGQYVIVDTGLVLPTGKAVKRAYSLLSSDAEQSRAQIAVKRIGEGLGSNYMHGLAPGARINFSGPWGKMWPQPGELPGATLILATDTGISAALGLVQSERLRPALAATTLVWLRVSEDDYLRDALVREHVPSACGALQIAPLPPIDHPERIGHVRDVLQRLLQQTPFARAYVSGDGAVNYALLDDLVAAGIPATRDNLESFFNMPKKSQALPAASPRVGSDPA